MKFVVFLCLLIVGSALSHQCTDKAKKICLDAMSTYPNVNTKIQTCRRLHMFRSCMQPKDAACHKYFDDVIEMECSVADYN
ncbi:Hypothetical predicted protein [Octopus vulgaris]|uniref:Uncharacterized protein n=1 Tax=Octopus vulgaris TaxID=6645 RepID=A0AA36BJY5_OCTVU|nr:Hypothetical predicted protein [Octopus vulgaris]